jgi:hypothetical protein
VCCACDQPTDFAIHDFVKQALLSLLAVIHARTEIGNYFELPSIGGAEQFKHLFVTLSVGFLSLETRA